MTAVQDYLSKFYGVDFKWGEIDCVNFVHGALEVQGHKVIDLSTCSKYDDEKSARRAFIEVLSKYKCTSMPQLLDKLMRRCYYVPDSGQVVAKMDSKDSSTGYRLGVIDGCHAVFIGVSGLVFERLNLEDYMYWTVK